MRRKRSLLQDRPDLRPYFSGVSATKWDNHNETFVAVVSGIVYDGEVVTQGFGLPHVILTLRGGNRATHQLALVETEGEYYPYAQDGDAPIHCAGWTYRHKVDGEVWEWGDWADPVYADTAEHAKCLACRKGLSLV